MGFGLTIASVLLFATWATLHSVLLVYIGKESIPKAALCLVFPPLAAAYGQHNPKLLTAWVGFAVLYGASLLLALTFGA